MKLELESLGHSVLTAEDGASGLELALRERPDVLVTDIMIPVIDGYELIRRLRSQPQTADIPAIALTALSMKTHVEKALSLGFDACLDKTCAIDELTAEIARLAARRRRQC